MVKKKRVIVGMSGGVDSSVAAALLKKSGFDVVGIFMKFWSAQSASRNLTDKKDGNRCCSVESEKLAMAVAKKIGIPFYVLNVEKEFKEKVVDYFLAEYKKGNTPNPCVVCNKEIKFGILIRKALALGADFVATGHYAETSLANQIFPAGRASLRGTLSSKKLIGSLRKVSLLRLFMGKDKEKDQSYFLWQLNQKQLSHVLFPVGGFTKPEVRKLAKKFDLPTAETPESQEVCFVSDTTNNFLKNYLKQKPGDIVAAPLGGASLAQNGRDNSGKIVGEHQGLWFYTIGQRKGIEVQQGPWYVVGKNFKKNILIVSKNEKDLLKNELIAKNVNWISGKEPKLPIKAQVKIRYKSNLVPSLIRARARQSLGVGGNKGGGVKVVFEKPQRAVTPGQSVVFYSGKELLGGGIIDIIR